MNLIPKIAIGSIMVAGSLLAADTRYVDCNLKDYTGHDGSSWEKALETIQEGVDMVQSGGIVLVAPGHYAKGERLEDESSNAISNRVVISKSLTLKSWKGKEKTFIVGAQDNGTVGDSAVRCVISTSSSADVTIDGFTICNGGTKDGGNNRLAQGGGVWAPNTTEPKTRVVDCVISNNVATRGGGMWGGVAFRTLFAENNATKAGVSFRCSSAVNCIFAEPYTKSSVFAVDSLYHVINCSFVGCEYAVSPEDSFANNFRNCLFAVCSTVIRSGKSAKPVFLNCVSETEVQNDRYNTADSSCFLFSVSPLLFAPAFVDYRPLKGSAADGTGNPDGMNQSFIPDSERTVDFVGNPRTTGGKINIGAIESVSEAQTGRIVFNSNATKGQMSVNGIPVKTPYMYAHGSVWPETFRMTVRPADGETLFGVYQSGAWNNYRYPDISSNIVSVMPRIGETVTNSPHYADKIVWAAPPGGKSVPEEPLGSENNPYDSLQAAVDTGNADGRTVVFAKSGTYRNGSKFGQSAMNRVFIDRAVRLVAVDRTKPTIIEGERDNDSESGCSASSVRCIGVANSKPCCIDGFTLTGGYSLGTASFGGGAVMADSSTSAQIIDCVISNNFSLRAAAAWGGWLQGCLISGNTVVSGGNSICRNGVATGCLFRDNNTQSYAAGFGSVNYHCTFDETSCIINASDASIVNCVMRRGSAITTPKNDDTVLFAGNIVWQVNSGVSHSGAVTVADLGEVDADSGDFRLRRDSPILGIGTAGTDSFARYAVCGFDGPVRFFGATPAPTPGAFQNPLTMVNLTAKHDGEISPVGVQYVLPGEELTVEAAAAGRNILAFNVEYPSGATEVFNVNPGERTYGLTLPSVPGEFKVSAVYATNWYVNAETGLDSNNGWTPETPKYSLAEVMEHVVSGDVVHAAAGTYDYGSAVSRNHKTSTGDECPSIRSRVVVPEGVTLVGENRETTFVVGKTDSLEHGLGTNAYRCVWLERDASIRNMTICGGRTAPHEAANYQDDNYMAGGVRGVAHNKTLVENCIISNCVSVRGGACILTTFRNCVIAQNHATVNGSAGRNCTLVGCLITGNTGLQTLVSMYDIVNCTYLADNQNPIGGPASDGNGLIANSLFMLSGTHTNPKKMVNVLLAPGAKMSGSEEETGTIKPEDLSLLGVDEQGHPVLGSEAIDAGDAEIARSYGLYEPGMTDVDGVQRIYNGGQIDIGCYEFDWRTPYANLLGRNSVTVHSADPAALAADKGVSLKSGGLSMAWTDAAKNSKRVKFTCRVLGAGTLTIKDGNGQVAETLTSADGEQTFMLSGGSLRDSMVFQYDQGAENDAGAMLSSFERFDPFVFVVR